MKFRSGEVKVPPDVEKAKVIAQAAISKAKQPTSQEMNDRLKKIEARLKSENEAKKAKDKYSTIKTALLMLGIGVLAISCYNKIMN